MAFLKLTVANPNLEDGTYIYDVSDGIDTKKFLGFGSNWNNRLRLPGKGGCPSWIDQIVVAKDLDTARSTRVRAVQPQPIASSSHSSRDVIAVLLDKNGEEDMRELFPFVYIVKSHPSKDIDPQTGKPIPIADEMWFSLTAVDDQKARDAEANCEGGAA